MAFGSDRRVLVVDNGSDKGGGVLRIVFLTPGGDQAAYMAEFLAVRKEGSVDEALRVALRIMEECAFS